MSCPLAHVELLELRHPCLPQPPIRCSRDCDVLCLSDSKPGCHCEYACHLDHYRPIVLVFLPPCPILCHRGIAFFYDHDLAAASEDTSEAVVEETSAAHDAAGNHEGAADFHVPADASGELDRAEHVQMGVFHVGAADVRVAGAAGGLKLSLIHI